MPTEGIVIKGTRGFDLVKSDERRTSDHCQFRHNAMAKEATKSRQLVMTAKIGLGRCGLSLVGRCAFAGLNTVSARANGGFPHLVCKSTESEYKRGTTWHTLSVYHVPRS